MSAFDMYGPATSSSSSSQPSALSFEDLVASSAMGFGPTLAEAPLESRGSPFSTSPPRDIPIGPSTGPSFTNPQAWAYDGSSSASSSAYGSAHEAFSQQSHFEPGPFVGGPDDQAFFNNNPSFSGHQRRASVSSSVSASPFLQPIVPASPALSSHSSHRASIDASGFSDEPLPMEVEGGFASLGLARRRKSDAGDEGPAMDGLAEDRFSTLDFGGGGGGGGGRRSGPGQAPSRYDTITWATENSKSREDTIMAPRSRDGSGGGQEDGEFGRKRNLSTGGMKPQLSVSNLAAAIEEQRRREREVEERRAVGASPPVNGVGANGKPAPPSLKITVGGPTNEEIDKMFVASPTQQSPTMLETAHPSRPAPQPPKPRLSLPKIDAPGMLGVGSPPLRLDVTGVGPSISLTSATPLTARPNRGGTLEFQRVLEELARGKREVELGMRQGSSSPRSGDSDPASRPASSSMLDPTGGRRPPRRQRSKSDSYSTVHAPPFDQAALFSMLMAQQQQQPQQVFDPTATFSGQTSGGESQPPATSTAGFDDAMASQFMPSGGAPAASTSPAGQFWSQQPGAFASFGAPQMPNQQAIFEAAMSMAQQQQQQQASAAGIVNGGDGGVQAAAAQAAATVMANMYGGTQADWQRFYASGGAAALNPATGWNGGTFQPQAGAESKGTSTPYENAFLHPGMAGAGAGGGIRRSHSLGGHRRNLSDTNVLGSTQQFDPSAFLSPYTLNGLLAPPGSTSQSGAGIGMAPPDAYGRPPFGTAQPSAFPGYASPSYSGSSPSAASESEQEGSRASRTRSWSHSSSVGSYVSSDQQHAGGRATVGQFGYDASPSGSSTGMVDWQSKTTEATKAAAKRRRKEGAEARYVCEMCGETFTRRYNLKGHQRAHKGEKPFRCEYPGCDKSFARQHDRKRHAKLHLGVKEYTCQACGKSFIRLDALQRHLRADAGQTCYKQLRATGLIPAGLDLDASSASSAFGQSE